jgi:uncharacterized membrane protein
MATQPSYDFQLSKSIRLRGWGWFGLAALILLLFAAIIASSAAGPLTSALAEAFLHLISSLKKLW